MQTPPDPPALDYKSPPRKPYIAPLTPQERRWLYLRLLFFTTLAFLFYIIACQVGPNEILFGKTTRITPADFVPIVQAQCLPIVRAIKEYQRDHGDFPEKLHDLVPHYLPADPDTKHEFSGAQPGRTVEYVMWTTKGHIIEYDFTPGNEGWSVSGPFARGKIPIPAVTVPPASAPTTSP